MGDSDASSLCTCLQASTKELVLLSVDFGDTRKFQRVGEFANMESVDNEDGLYLPNGTSAAKKEEGAAWRPTLDRAVSGVLSEKEKLKPEPEGGGGDGHARCTGFSGVFFRGQVQSGHCFIQHNLRVVRSISALYFELPRGWSFFSFCSFL